MIVIVLCAIALLSLAAHLGTTDADGSRYNLQWNGTSHFFGMLEERGVPEVVEPEALDRMRGGLLLIVAPGRMEDPRAVSAYRRYLERGGRIFVAGETRDADAFLHALGSGVRIVEGTLCSLDTAFSSACTPVAYLKAGAVVSGNVTTLHLNHPAALEGGEALMETSLFSWVDADGDMRVGSGERMARRPVLVRETLYNGTLFVLGDESIFVNGMLQATEGGENPRFVSGLLAEEGLAVDLYASRAGKTDGVMWWLLQVRRAYMLRAAIVTVALMLLALVWYRMELRNGRGGSV